MKLKWIKIVVCFHNHQSVLHLHFHILNTIGLPSLPWDIWQFVCRRKEWLLMLYLWHYWLFIIHRRSLHKVLPDSIYGIEFLVCHSIQGFFAFLSTLITVFCWRIAGFVFCLGRKHKSNTQVVCMLIAKGSLRTIFCRTWVELVPHLLILKVDLLRAIIMFERVTEGTAHRFLSACYGRLIHFVLVQTVFDT